jgi:HEAT repeat protein
MGENAKTAVPQLIEMLKDKNNFVRSFSGDVLLKVEPRLIEIVMTAKKAKEAKEAAEAAEAEEAVSQLIELLKDTDSEDMNVPFSFMGTSLRREIELFRDAKIRPWDQYYLLSPEESMVLVPSLVEELKDEDYDVRQRAAWKLRMIARNLKTAVPSLVEELKDEGGSAKRRLVEELKDEGGSAKRRLGFRIIRGVSQMTEELKDIGLDVRINAAEALGTNGVRYEEAVSQMIEMLKDERAYVRSYAVDALRIIAKNAKTAASQVAELLKDKDPGVRERAAEALERIGEKAKAAAPQVGELLNDKDLGVRLAALRALESTGEKAKAAVPQRKSRKGLADELELKSVPYQAERP